MEVDERGVRGAQARATPGQERARTLGRDALGRIRGRGFVLVVYVRVP